MPTLRIATLFAVLVSSLALACQPQQPAEDGETAAGTADRSAGAVEAIRQLDRQFVQMVADKDTAGIVRLYVEGAGRIMPPQSPAMVGHEALRQFWGAAVNFPKLSFGPDTIVVSAGGDMALDIGSATYRTPGAEADTHGKYVVVWVKRDGQWKILADIFNTNAP